MILLVAHVGTLVVTVSGFRHRSLWWAGGRSPE